MTQWRLTPDAVIAGFALFLWSWRKGAKSRNPVSSAATPYNPRQLALAPGTRLGVYEVTAPIGEGGMGQVFRARDTTLNRDVALKILPDSFANDPDRLARFTREAQTLASLNHPNIAQIHGLEEFPRRAVRIRALVMELVEGDDLSQRIARGAISTRRSAADREADRRGARSGARAGHHPSRSQAGEHQGATGRHREGARLRIGQGTGSGSGRRRSADGRSNSPTITIARDDAGGDDPGHRRVHVAGAGAWKGRGQARGHLGVRVRAPRDADGHAPLRGRLGPRNAGTDLLARARSDDVAGRDTRTCPHADRAVSRQGSPSASARHRRGAAGAGRCARHTRCRPVIPGARALALGAVGRRRGRGARCRMGALEPDRPRHNRPSGDAPRDRVPTRRGEPFRPRVWRLPSLPTAGPWR